MVVRGLAKGPVRPRPTCGRLLYAATLPFLAAVLVGAALFNGRSGSLAAIVRQPSRVVLENPPCTGPECSGREDGVQLAAAGSSAGLAGGADDGDAPPAGELPPLFMFIGILSGRGYRHRRLAVREAWSNRAQVEGLVVSKFILSEDERTPQVQKEMEQFNDIVFVKEKTNYKSILYKTFFVSGVCCWREGGRAEAAARGRTHLVSWLLAAADTRQCGFPPLLCCCRCWSMP